jgi:hypothetical protein
MGKEEWQRYEDLILWDERVRKKFKREMEDFKSFSAFCDSRMSSYPAEPDYDTYVNSSFMPFNSRKG